MADNWKPYDCAKSHGGTCDTCLSRSVCTDTKATARLGTDPVQKPSHYMLEGLDIEAIDVIRSVLGPERFQGYCRGNEIKYLLRADHKNGTEDLEKAQVYLGWEIQSRKEQHEEDNE